MKNPLLLLLGSLLFGVMAASGATPGPTRASFAGNYKPTVSTILLADDNDAFVGGSYTNFTFKINRNGRGRGKALFHSPDGISVVPVKLKVSIGKLEISGSKATAEFIGVGSDQVAFLGAADVKLPSRKRMILVTLVKGDYHSYALFVGK